MISSIASFRAPDPPKDQKSIFYVPSLVFSEEFAALEMASLALLDPHPPNKNNAELASNPVNNNFFIFYLQILM